MTWLLLAAGLALLVFGAECLVKGASGIAAAVGVPSLVIGLTVVALGTSAPEMSVSVASALDGRADLAIGNVVGSNILNVLLILGLCAVIAPLAVQRQLVRLDVPIMIGASALVYAFLLDGSLGRTEAALLCAGLAGYMALQVAQARKEGGGQAGGADADAGALRRRHPWWVDVALVLLGLALLVLGSRWLVESAVTLARAFGMSELLIGLTLVALGTSLPEVATSVMASLRGERDIAVGNVVGSNVFNLLGVLGVTGVVAPSGLPVSAGALGFDVPVMVAVAVGCLPIFFTGHTIARWEGWLFLAYYAAYTIYIFLAASAHEAAPLFGRVLIVFVIPLTALTLALFVARSVRDEHARPPANG